MAGSSPPQLSRVTPIVSWKRVGGNLRRWLAEYEEQSIRALISRHDGKSNERILAVWKLRKTAGNWRSLILTSEAIYDATLGHRSCKRRCHLATVRAITASTVSGQFLIHIDDSYDALYVDRKARRARLCPPHQLRRTPAPAHASPTAPHPRTEQAAPHRTGRAGCLRTPPHRSNETHETTRTAPHSHPRPYPRLHSPPPSRAPHPPSPPPTTTTITSTVTTSTVATVATRQLAAASHRTRRTKRLPSTGSCRRRPSSARWRCRCYTHQYNPLPAHCCTPLSQVELLHPPLQTLTRALLHLPLASGVAPGGYRPHAHPAALQRLARPVEQQVAGPPPP